MAMRRKRAAESRRSTPADALLIESMLRLGMRDAGLLGHALARLRAVSGQSPEEQARGLGLTTAALAYLGIAKTPRPERRSEDLAAVAARVGLAVGRLELVLEEAERIGQAVQGNEDREDDDGRE
jgi:hypothetical protein